MAAEKVWTTAEKIVELVRERERIRAAEASYSTMLHQRQLILVVDFFLNDVSTLCPLLHVSKSSYFYSLQKVSHFFFVFVFGIAVLLFFLAVHIKHGIVWTFAAVSGAGGGGGGGGASGALGGTTWTVVIIY